MLEHLKDGDNPRTIEINKIDLWVQLHGMSTGFMSQRVATDIGNYIGTYVKGGLNSLITNLKFNIVQYKVHPHFKTCIESMRS